jgi:hypothetical protein
VSSRYNASRVEERRHDASIDARRSRRDATIANGGAATG